MARTPGPADAGWSATSTSPPPGRSTTPAIRPTADRSRPGNRSRCRSARTSRNPALPLSRAASSRDHRVPPAMRRSVGRRNCASGQAAASTASGTPVSPGRSEPAGRADEPEHGCHDDPTRRPRRDGREVAARYDFNGPSSGMHRGTPPDRGPRDGLGRTIDARTAAVRRAAPSSRTYSPMTTEQTRARAAGDRHPTTARMVIGGETVDAADGQTFEVVNPATGGSIATAPLGGKADVDRAVEAAQKAFDDRRAGRAGPPASAAGRSRSSPRWSRSTPRSSPSSRAATPASRSPARAARSSA